MIMGAFDVIECGYNAADETINFGTRNIASGDNLYEACTLAVLKCSENHADGVLSPHLSGAVHKGRIFFTIDCSFKIFEDQDCSAISFNANFDSIVDTFCVSFDGNFLLICLRNGSLHLIDTKDENKIVASMCLAEDNRDENFFSENFFVGSFSYFDSFLVVTKTGKVYKVSFKETTKIEFKCDYDFCCKTKGASFQDPFLLVYGTKLSVLNFEYGSIISTNVADFKKTFPIDKNMFLALDYEGNLYHISPNSLVIVPLDIPTKYKDFLVISDDLNDQRQIIVITGDNSQESSIQVLSYPGFSELYSLEISNDVILITPEFINDELLYISKITNENNRVFELRFHVVNETEPEQRLERLLRKQRFEEAEKFAHLFHLNFEIIRKAKVQVIIEKLQIDSDDVNDLINLLNLIEDDIFKLQCCVDVESCCVRFDDVRKVLSYGYNLVPKKQLNKSLVEELEESVADLMFRYDTFVALNRGTEPEMQEWKLFARCELMEDMMRRLKNYQIEEANVIYNRLDELTILNLTESHICLVLDVLNNMPIATYQPFLPNFLRITLDILPSSLSLFVKWTKKMVFHLEKRSIVEFPDNAIKFTENIIRLVKTSDTTDISFQRQSMLDRQSFSDLSQLLTALKRLQRLKDEFRFTIPVKVFLSGPEEVIKNLLNVTLSLEYFDIFLNEFLSQFLLENRLEPNKIFFSVVENLLEYNEADWVDLITSLLNCITSIPMKLKAVERVLNIATMPWRPTIRKIAHDALAYNHPLVADIRELIEEEPVQIVLRRPKYEIRERMITDDSILAMVINRIIYCEEETMVEDVLQLCKTPTDRHMANMSLIKHFIRRGNFIKATEILDDNTPEEVHSCAEELFLYVQSAINKEMGVSSNLRDNYYEMAPLILRRLKTNEFEDSCNKEIFDLLKNVYNLEKYLKIKTTTDCLRKNKNGIISDILEPIFHEFEAGKRSVDEIFAVCTKISTSLSVPSDQILIKFCEKTDDYNIIFQSAKRIFEQDVSSRNLSLMAVLLLKYVGVYKLELLNDSSSEIDNLNVSDSVIDNELFCQGFQLADMLITKAIFKANSDELSFSMEVANWVATSFYFTREDNNLKKVLFGDIFEPASLIPGFITFPFLRNAFNLYCNQLQSYEPDAVAKYLTHFDGDSPKTDLLKETKHLLSAVDGLSKEGQDLTAFKVVLTLHNSLLNIPNINSSVLTLLNDVLKKKCLPKLLVSLLGSSVIDGDLLYNLLLSYAPQDCIDFIANSMRKYKRQPRKFTSIVQLGLRLLDYHDISNKTDLIRNLTTMKWWKRFGKKLSDYAGFCKAKPDERFEMLVQTDCMDMKLVEEYAKDYGIAPKVLNVYYFKRTLLNWKPDYEIITHSNRESNIVIKNNEIDLLHKCQTIMQSIEPKEILACIQKNRGIINPYYYEVFIVMYEILSELDPKQNNCEKLSMLSFLKAYQRVGKPSEPEIETWYTIFPETQTLDPLSEYRIPFNHQLFTNQVWNILRPEVNLKTYKIWFHVIEMGRVCEFLKVDDICAYVVNDVVASGVLGGESKEWVLYPKHEDLFAEIDECVKNISDLERTTSVVYHLLGHTPNGADQVNAAALCYQYALEYKKQHPNRSDVEAAFVKVEKKYFSACAMHILHKYQLAEKKYIRAISNHDELILALYLDERILKTRECGDSYCPDINKATEELASLFSLTILDKRKALVESWLSDSPVTAFDFDCSAIYTHSGCDDDNLKRAAYVCYTEEIDFWRTHLLKMGLGSETEEQKSVTCKARALKVFAMITDVETIATLTELTYDEFLNFIDKLTIISNLEYLGVDLDIESLSMSNKDELLNRLARRAGNVLSVKTMAAICMTFRIYNLKYWEFIVNAAIKFSLFGELKNYVNFLHEAKYHNKHFFINAWQKLIDHLFASVSDQESELNEILVNNFLTIQSCPVSYSLNFDKIFRKCIVLKKIEFAAVLLQYAKGETRDKYVEEILNCRDFGTALNNLTQSGISGISHVQAILANNCK